MDLLGALMGDDEVVVIDVILGSLAFGFSGHLGFRRIEVPVSWRPWGLSVFGDWTAWIIGLLSVWWFWVTAWRVVSCGGGELLAGVVVGVVVCGSIGNPH